MELSGGSTVHTYTLSALKDTCGLVLCARSSTTRQSEMIQTRGELKLSYDSESTELDSLVQFLTREFSEKLVHPLTLAKPAKIIDSLTRSAFERSEPSIVLSQFATPANMLSLSETAIHEGLQGERIEEEDSFLPNEDLKEHHGLFSTDLTKVLEQLDQADITSSQILPQNLDSVPQSQEADSLIGRRASETILTQVSRKPPLRPAQPSDPRPASCRPGSSPVKPKPTHQRMESDTKVFGETQTQIEKYALEYHRPRRTGEMYSGEEPVS